MRTGDRTVYKVAQKWEECPGRRARDGASKCTYAPEVGGRKACPVCSQKTGMQFPFEASTGKCIPFWAWDLGRIFRQGLQKESASHSDAGFRATLSQTGSKWKAHPALRLYSGMHFPQEPSVKEKDPLCRGPSQFKVAGKGIASARCADGPLRRFAPCELRWQTLTRLLSSAPSRGSIPCGAT